MRNLDTKLLRRVHLFCLAFISVYRSSLLPVAFVCCHTSNAWAGAMLMKSLLGMCLVKAIPAKSGAFTGP